MQTGALGGAAERGALPHPNLQTVAKVLPVRWGSLGCLLKRCQSPSVADDQARKR